MSVIHVLFPLPRKERPAADGALGRPPAPGAMHGLVALGALGRPPTSGPLSSLAAVSLFLAAVSLSLPPALAAQAPPEPCPEPPALAERMAAMAERMGEAQERLRGFMQEEGPRLRAAMQSLADMQGRAATQSRAALQARAAMQSRAALGVEFDRVRDEEVHRGGVLLSGVRRGSPAAEAGLEAGDRILRFDDISLDRPLPEGEEELDAELAPSVARLLHLARALEPGQTVRLRVERDGEERTVEVTARRLPGLSVAAFRMPEGAMGWDTILVWPPGMRGAPPERLWWGPQAPPSFRGPEGRVPLAFPGFGIGPLGLRLHDLNEGLARYFGRTEGALILEAPEDGPLPVEAGDVIIAVDGREVEDAAHAGRILRSYRSGEDVTLTVWREGREVRVEGRVP